MTLMLFGLALMKSTDVCLTVVIVTIVQFSCCILSICTLNIACYVWTGLTLISADLVHWTMVRYCAIVILYLLDFVVQIRKIQKVNYYNGTVSRLWIFHRLQQNRTPRAQAPWSSIASLSLSYPFISHRDFRLWGAGEILRWFKSS